MGPGSRPAFFRRALRRRWITIALTALVGLLLGAATIATATVEYRSTAVVFLDPLVGNPYSPTTPSTRQEQLAALTTEAGLVLTDAVVTSADEAARAQGVDLGPQIQERTTTEVPSNSQVVHITFLAGTPEAAQVGAQSLAESYLAYRQERSGTVIEEQVARADEQIESLTALLAEASAALNAANPGDATTVSADVLNLQEQVRIYANQLGQVRIERSTAASTAVSPGEIVSPARLPRQPEGFSATLVAAALVIAAIGAGALLALLQEHLDTRLHAVDDIDAVGAGPAFGPLVGDGEGQTTTVGADGYRLVMNALQIDGTRHAVVPLLSADTGTPVSVAANLAHAVVDADKAVIVVVVDPAAGGDEGVGLSDALQDATVSSTDAFLHELRPGLRLMSAGRQAADLPNLVQRPAFGELVKTLSRLCDVVLVVGPGADTATGAAIARVAGVAVLVATVARTTRSALLTSAHVLEESGARLDGVLLISRKPPGRRRFRRRRGYRPTTARALLSQASAEVTSDDADDVDHRTDSPVRPAGSDDHPAEQPLQTGSGNRP